ncbi:hypothetical protein BLA9940_03222 [Burkholderia aenigmatica]|uniref:DUF1579 domain-containing protein n=1 Tax=Burkholderia aenigmatica TaxID=2015348 RepID=A0A6J5INX2_9BURK|nr:MULTISPECIES: hypothetical protein [Burkholderia]AYQ40873.1 hypothetical protein CVS37_22725 [Burkholderia lata]UKD15806.1 hypothetical protein L3V59_23010 [Burkholderia aenigmatica]CAB3961101.1 hypothetical protein BLA3211_00840 [Burkholderia aenigmatica]VWC61706.1 hypothetical protein BLA9940_03222 [Burkholderia aenigmatica]
MNAPLPADGRVAPAPGDFPFLGVWALEPGRSVYAFGMPPLDGTYTVALDDDGWLDITSRWRTAAGRTREIHFAGKLGGGRFPYSSTGAADELGFEFEPPGLLRSSAFKNNEKVHWAERRLDGSGVWMTISVFGRFSDGRVYQNQDVYRRVVGGAP